MNKRGYCAIGLDNPKNKLNIGSVLRAAYIYSSAFVAATGKRYERAITDTMAAHKHMPLFQPADDLFQLLPFNCVPVAVEILDGAISLPEYKHPERAFYIFGAEDNTLGKRITEKCRDVIYIPTKSCMNLAATVNVVLYDRMCKQEKLEQ